MAAWDAGRLTEAQSALVATWLPGVQMRADLSWGLLDTVVLEVSTPDDHPARDKHSRGGENAHRRSGARTPHNTSRAPATPTTHYIVKAGGPANHHMGREITAHLTATAPLLATGHTSTMRHFDREHGLLVIDYLDGDLVQGTPAEWDPDVYRQAGRLLWAFHAQSQHAHRVDAEPEADATRRTLADLQEPSGIASDVVDRVRGILLASRPRPVAVVPTHGDWQPRNWLLDGTTVKVIDFGRFGYRSASSDLVRLAVQQWRTDRRLEAAFFEGYGADPREAESWRLLLLREAVGTVVWSRMVGDSTFEAQGHRMLAEALDLF